MTIDIVQAVGHKTLLAYWPKARAMLRSRTQHYRGKPKTSRSVGDIGCRAYSFKNIVNVEFIYQIP